MKKFFILHFNYKKGKRVHSIEPIKVLTLNEATANKIKIKGKTFYLDELPSNDPELAPRAGDLIFEQEGEYFLYHVGNDTFTTPSDTDGADFVIGAHQDILKCLRECEYDILDDYEIPVTEYVEEVNDFVQGKNTHTAMQLEEFLRKHQTFIEDLEDAARRLGHNKNDLLSCNLERYANELKEHDPQRKFPFNPFNPM